MGVSVLELEPAAYQFGGDMVHEDYPFGRSLVGAHEIRGEGTDVLPDAAVGVGKQQFPLGIVGQGLDGFAGLFQDKGGQVAAVVGFEQGVGLVEMSVHFVFNQYLVVAQLGGEHDGHVGFDSIQGCRFQFDTCQLAGGFHILAVGSENVIEGHQFVDAAQGEVVHGYGYKLSVISCQLVDGLNV